LLSPSPSPSDLTIQEKTQGVQHPSTNVARGNLARLRLTQRAPSEALALSKAALGAHDKVLGANHPWTKVSAGIIASALAALGRADEAAAVRARYGLGGGSPPEGGASGAEGAGGERDHDQKRAERGELDDVAQGMGGGMHIGLLDHEEFIICSCYVPVNSTGSEVLSELGHSVNEIRTLWPNRGNSTLSIGAAL
jgi:hypothetical protein